MTMRKVELALGQRDPELPSSEYTHSWFLGPTPNFLETGAAVSPT